MPLLVLMMSQEGGKQLCHTNWNLESAKNNGPLHWYLRVAQLELFFSKDCFLILDARPARIPARIQLLLI